MNSLAPWWPPAPRSQRSPAARQPHQGPQDRQDRQVPQDSRGGHLEARGIVVGAWERPDRDVHQRHRGFRVRWEDHERNQAWRRHAQVVFRSGDSGRPIIEAVDVTGLGHDAVEVADNVRWYYLAIESANVDWTVTVDERFRGYAGRRLRVS